MKKYYLLCIIITAFSGVMLAQKEFKFSAQIRPRFEFDDRDFRASNNPNYYSLLRTRLGLSFNPTKDLSGFVQIQDSRYFGEETSTLANTKNLDLHQAYVKIDDLFDLPVDLKIGRMELIYGSERLIGAVNWNNVGRSFDGLVFTITGKKFKADLFSIKEYEKFFLGDSLDQNVLGIYSDLMFFKSYKIQPFIIWQRAIPTDLLSRFTLGFYVKGDVKGFSHETEFAYQLGDIISGSKKQDVGAYMFAFNSSYAFKGHRKLTVGIGIDYLSGDDNLLDTDYKVFNTLYATNHKYYGYMDYFTILPVDTYGLGLLDLIGGISMSPTDKFKISVALHLFKSNTVYKLLNGSKSRDFGLEGDLLLNYNYNENVMFEGGFSLFSPGEIFKERKGKDISTWFYLMAVVNM